MEIVNKISGRNFALVKQSPRIGGLIVTCHGAKSRQIRLSFLAQFLLQQITFQHPDFIHRVFAGDLAANFSVEILRACAGAFAGDGEAVAQHQDAERQKRK